MPKAAAFYEPFKDRGDDTGAMLGPTATTSGVQPWNKVILFVARLQLQDERINNISKGCISMQLILVVAKCKVSELPIDAGIWDSHQFPFLSGKVTYSQTVLGIALQCVRLGVGELGAV